MSQKDLLKLKIFGRLKQKQEKMGTRIYTSIGLSIQWFRVIDKKYEF